MLVEEECVLTENEIHDLKPDKTDDFLKLKKSEYQKLLDFAKQLKHRAGFENIKLCPKCVFTAVRHVPYTGGIFPEMYYCPRCDWKGHIALEVSVDDLVSLWKQWEVEYQKDTFLQQEEVVDEHES